MTGGTDDLWERSGRRAVAMTLDDARTDVEDALQALTAETLYRGTDPTPGQIRAARVALNKARLILEEQAAPAAGCEEWGTPVPSIPMPVLWELTDHPRADGVDPRTYVEEEADE